jgi:hypothetical protein
VETVPLDGADLAAPGPHIDLVALEDALDALARVSARSSQVVELRFFGGFTVEETAEALGVWRDTGLIAPKLALSSRASGGEWRALQDSNLRPPGS